MLKRHKGITIFIAAALMILILILFIPSSCGVESTGPGPVGNGTPTGGWNTSPEDSIVQVLLNEFEDQFQVKPRIAFFGGNIVGFLAVLDSILNTHKHLDYVGFYSDDLTELIAHDWLKPYPRSIIETAFQDVAIRRMKSNDTLYGVPIYIAQDGRVKGIGVSTKIEDDLENTVLQWINFVTNSENSLRIAEAVEGTPALKSILPDLVPVPDSFGSFCIFDGSGLIVTVKNQGLSSSAESITEVDFGNLEKISILTPALRPDESIELHFEKSNVLNIQITVDAVNDVSETDEENNTVSDFCNVVP